MATLTSGALHVAGELQVPGDKSISHRALICGALAEGKSRIRGILPSADVQSTAGVLRTLGVGIPELSATMEIAGAGRRSLREEERPFNKIRAKGVGNPPPPFVLSLSKHRSFFYLQPS